MERTVSLFLEISRDGVVWSHGWTPDGGYSGNYLQPTHRVVRVAVRNGVEREDWVRQLAGVFATTSENVQVAEQLDLLPHELNAPFGSFRETSVYRCVVASRTKNPCHLSEDSKDIALIDLMPNLEGESGHRGFQVSDKDVLTAEAELLGLTAPSWITLDNELRSTLSEWIVSVAPLRPEETLQHLGVAFATRSIENNDRSASYGLKPSSSKPVPEKGGAHDDGNISIVLGKDEQRGERAIGILLVPAREYAFFNTVTVRYFSPYRYSSVVCYEALLTRLYGNRYRLEVPNSSGYMPRPDVISRACATAVKAAFHAGASLAEAFSGSHIRMACSLAQKSYARAGIFPPPRYPRPANRKRSNTHQPEGYRGGAILPAVVGIHERTAALCDFDSHYPSIICEYSLSPEIYGTTDGRDGPTAEMSDLIDKKRKETDPVEKKALKLASVTYYGAHGTVHSPIFSTKIAAAITEHGRRLLGMAREGFEAGGGAVVFGHTDSVTETGIDVRAVDAICTTFSGQFGKVRLEREKTFEFLWVLNRTTYIGRLSGTSSGRPVGLLYDSIKHDIEAMCQFHDPDEGFLYDSIKRDVRAMCRLHDPEDDLPELMGYMKTWQDITESFSRILKTAKQCLVFPGLISSVRPVIMNVLTLVIASFCVDICSADDAEAEECECALRKRLESFLKQLEIEERTVYPCSVPAWTYEFPLAPYEKAKRGASENARLSRTIWNDIEKRSKHISLAAKRVMAEHLKVHCLEDPETGPYLVDPEDVHFPLNKYKWLSQVYRTWCGYTRDLAASGQSVCAARIRSLLAPLERLCSQNPHLGRRHVTDKKPSAGSSPSALVCPPDLLKVPETIQEVRSIILKWVATGGPCPRKEDADGQLELVRQHLQKIAGLSDPRARSFSVSLLFLRLDASEALLMATETMKQCLAARSDSGFQTHIDFYRAVLELGSQHLR